MKRSRPVPSGCSPATSRGFTLLEVMLAFVIFALMLVFLNQWFWVSMPFMLTFLVMALGYM